MKKGATLYSLRKQGEVELVVGCFSPSKYGSDRTDKNKRNNTGVFCRRKVKREFLPVGSSPFSLTAIFGEVATLTFSSIEEIPYVATSPIHLFTDYLVKFHSPYKDEGEEFCPVVRRQVFVC